MANLLCSSPPSYDAAHRKPIRPGMMIIEFALRDDGTVDVDYLGRRQAATRGWGRDGPLAWASALIKPTMRLSGKQKQQVHDALLSAFPAKASLAQMLAFQMEVALDAIVRDGGLSQQVFELIVWAEAQGRLHELITSARQSVPGNAAVQQVEEDLETLRLGLHPRLLELIVRTFLDGYYQRVQLEMLLRFNFDRNLNEIATTTGSLRDDVKRLIITAQKESWLENLLDAAIADRPQNPTFQRLREEMLALRPPE